MQIQAADYTVYGLSLATSIFAVQTLGASHPLLLLGLAFVILVGGLPHGALDYFILRRIFQGSAFAFSLLIYVGVAALNLGIWIIFPSMIFPVFLSYSVYHFGSSDRSGHPLHNQLAWGLSIIGLPCLLAPSDTFVYFNLFLPQIESVAVIYSLSALCVGSLALGVMDPKNRKERWITLLVYSAILTFANVLSAFTFYFVFIHSKIHERAWLAYVPKSDFHILRGLTLMVVVGVMGLTAFCAQAGRFPSLHDPLYQFIRNIFWVLGSLTVSHMLLAYVLALGAPILPNRQFNP